MARIADARSELIKRSAVGFRSSSGELVECAEHLRTRRIAALMAGVPDRDELRVRPGAGELPRGVQWPTQVEATVDQDARNAGQASGVAQQGAFLQPRAVGEVVRADADERQWAAGGRSL